MKIVKRNKKILDIDLFSKAVTVSNENEILTVLNWHNQMNNRWASGDKPNDETMINLLNGYVNEYGCATIELSPPITCGAHYEDSNISFNDFLELAYQ